MVRESGLVRGIDGLLRPVTPRISVGFCNSRTGRGMKLSSSVNLLVLISGRGLSCSTRVFSTLDRRSRRFVSTVRGFWEGRVVGNEAGSREGGDRKAFLKETRW